jgi:hypothetical protein
MANINSYESAAKYLGAKADRPLENNTRLQRRNCNDIAVKYHDTDIVTFRSDGSIVVNSGGWRTSTTKERINRYAGLHISQYKSIWYVTAKLLFADNGRIEADGSLLGFEDYSPSVDSERNKLFKRIKVYCAAYIKKLQEGEVPAPSSGDCWYCSMTVESTGLPLGDKQSDHILAHMDEGYYVPSLLVNATKNKLATYHTWVLSAAFNYHKDIKAKEFIDKTRKDGYVWTYLQRQLYKYIKAQLGYSN